MVVAGDGPSGKTMTNATEGTKLRKGENEEDEDQPDDGNNDDDDEDNDGKASKTTEKRIRMKENNKITGNEVLGGFLGLGRVRMDWGTSGTRTESIFFILEPPHFW